MDDSPVRVGFVIDALAPGAGTENQLLFLLRNFDPDRIRPYLYLLRNSEPPPVSCPYENFELKSFRSPSAIACLRRFRRSVRREGLDVVITFFRDANLFGTIGAYLAQVPVVSSRRNLGRGYWHTTRELWKLRWLNRLTWMFLANSHAVRDYTVEAEGVPADRIRVIPNAVDLTEFRPAGPRERGRQRQELGLPETGLLVGCVANLRRIKGVDTLVLAWKDVSRDFPEAALVLVGEGEEENRLRQTVRDLGCGGSVHFLGHCHETAALLRAFDIGVLPSRGESLSNSLLEYLATGLPSVATDVGGNRELVSSTEVGRLVPPESPEALAVAIVELSRDAGLRAQLGTQARQRAEENFSIGAVIEMWSAVLESIANQRGQMA